MEAWVSDEMNWVNNRKLSLSYRYEMNPSNNSPLDTGTYMPIFAFYMQQVE